MISDDCDLWIYPTKTYIMLGKEKNVRSLKLPYFFSIDVIEKMRISAFLQQKRIAVNSP